MTNEPQAAGRSATRQMSASSVGRVGDDDCMAERPRDHERVLIDYRATLLAMHRERIESGGTPRAWNRLVNRLQKLHLELRETPEGRGRNHSHGP